MSSFSVSNSRESCEEGTSVFLSDKLQMVDEYFESISSKNNNEKDQNEDGDDNEVLPSSLQENFEPKLSSSSRKISYTSSQQQQKYHPSSHENNNNNNIYKENEKITDNDSRKKNQHDLSSNDFTKKLEGGEVIRLISSHKAEVNKREEISISNTNTSNQINTNQKNLNFISHNNTHNNHISKKMDNSEINNNISEEEDEEEDEEDEDDINEEDEDEEDEDDGNNDKKSKKINKQTLEERFPWAKSHIVTVKVNSGPLGLKISESRPFRVLSILNINEFENPLKNEIKVGWLVIAVNEIDVTQFSFQQFKNLMSNLSNQPKDISFRVANENLVSKNKEKSSNNSNLNVTDRITQFWSNLKSSN